jgi:hypothetical protein
MPSNPPPTNAQMLSQLMAKKKKKNLTDFKWTPHVQADEDGNQLHKDTFVYMDTPVATSPQWHRTAAKAREETAFYVLPVITEALR